MYSSTSLNLFYKQHITFHNGLCLGFIKFYVNELYIVVFLSKFILSRSGFLWARQFIRRQFRFSYRIMDRRMAFWVIYRGLAL